MLKSRRIRVGITIGDPSGIGPAITAKAMDKIKGLADFVVIGDARLFKKIQGYKFINLDNLGRKHFEFGKIRAEYGRASIEYLDKAIELIKNKEVDCLVTCPISKEAINLAGFHYSGHTEYLARQTEIKDVVMMLLNNRLRFSLVTRHISLKKVASELKKDILYKTIFLTHQSLKKFFAIRNPRIVVCALNPHASDNGTIGREENRVIKPLLNRLKRRSLHIDGPLSADIAIAKAYRKEYDCVIAMYHDQALIPLKLCGLHSGVNITLGLPFVRTSPLHGTAFDIASNYASANPDSLIEAIELAVKCTANLKRA